VATGRKTGGRKRGTPNARTRAVTERLEAMNCDPIEAMARLAQEAEKENDKALAGRMYSELAGYCAPKRKAIEQEIITEPPLSLEQAIEECITFLKEVPDNHKQEILQAIGIYESQDKSTSEEMFDMH